MWIADGWDKNEYEVLDASDGEKLERWGGYILVRPDPQVIWKTEKKDPGWKRANGIYHRSARGGGSWEIRELPKQWDIHYKDLTFRLQPFAFKHTGIFPEQAVNWEWMAGKVRKALQADRTEGPKKASPKERTGRPGEEPRGIRVLNLFAYTGGATLALLNAGASVTHVDASKGMVTWAKENSVLSGLDGRPVRWLVDDCKKFVEREIRRDNTYDAIVMDPPSYGRGPKGEVWQMEDAIYDLVSLCGKLLSREPLFFVLNSYTTGLAPAVLKYILSTALGKEEVTGAMRNGGKVNCEAGEIGLKVRSTGLVLPCGACGRWYL